IALNKESLTKILNTTSSFYRFTSIKVNSQKSILVTNSIALNKTITFDNEQLTVITNGILFKYLEAWFSTNRKPILVQKKIMAEAVINLKKLQFAYITEKQAIFIIN
ncbi:8683_t:CDS:1, partial [Ambispora leptoticha]